MGGVGPGGAFGFGLVELVLTVEMGVPKFYRWISERYPCLSEVVKEHQVGERGLAARRSRTWASWPSPPRNRVFRSPPPARHRRIRG